MKQSFYIILITFLNYACSQSPSETVISEPTSETEYLTVPFDTAEVIANLNIVDYMNRLDLIESDTASGLYDKVDTIICNINYGIYRFNSPWPGIQYKDSTAVYSTYGFNDSLNQYYLDPIFEELKIIKNIPLYPGFSGLIMLIGRKYKIPYKEGELSEKSWAGQRFKYYYYELIPPYTVYGPPIKPEDNEDENIIFYLPEIEIKELQTKKE